MKTFRIAAHGLALLFANFVSILIGFAAYHVLRPANQIAVQAPIAVVFSVLLFAAWMLVLRRPPFDRLRLRSPIEILWTYVASLMWGPVIFAPLHYLTQGYVTSLGNVIALLMFQAPANIIAILLAGKIIPPKDRQVSTEGAQSAEVSS